MNKALCVCVCEVVLFCIPHHVASTPGPYEFAASSSSSSSAAAAGGEVVREQSRCRRHRCRRHLSSSVASGSTKTRPSAPIACSGGRRHLANDAAADAGEAAGAPGE